jgi:hypothetical protein
MQLLGGRERKARAEIKAHLMAEDRQSAGPGTVAFRRAAGKNPFHQIVVLLHGSAFKAAKEPTRQEFTAVAAIDRPFLASSLHHRQA